MNQQTFTHLNYSWGQVLFWKQWRGVKRVPWPAPLDRIYSWSLFLGWIEVRRWAR
jgi:hypothetical protein